MGKTQWAKSLLPDATVVRHRNQLESADYSKGIIFDDFGVSHWPPQAIIHLLDWDEESGIDIKHSLAIIPPNTKKIFTYNQPPDGWICDQGDKLRQVHPETKAAILRRIIEIEVVNKLY